MERKDFESELRQRFADNREQIIKRIMDRLREEGVLKTHKLSSEGKVYLDGELVEGWETFERLFDETLDKVMVAVILEVREVLFGGERA